MKGDGSIYEVTDNHGRSRWVAQLAVVDRAHPIRRRLPVGAVKKDAERLLRRMQNERARGELGKKEAAEVETLPTLGEWMNRWHDAGSVGGRRSQRQAPGARTRAMHAGLIRNDIAPSKLGRMRLDDLRRRHVVDFLEHLADLGRAQSTIELERSMCARAWRWAQERYEDQLTGNPFDVGIPAAKAPAKRRALTPDELVALLAAGDEHRMLGGWVPLSVDTGMRPGEVAALTWPDLDLEATPPTVTVTRSIAWVPRPDPQPGEEKTMPVETHTKTGESGWRRVTISPTTVAALKAHRKRLAAERLAARGFWPTHQDGIDLTNRIFRSTKGDLVKEKTLRHQTSRVATEAGIGHVTGYDLRHTGATLIAEHHGEEISSKALGHVRGRSKITAGYIHRRRLETVHSAVLDLALAEATKNDDAQEAAQ